MFFHYSVLACRAFISSSETPIKSINCMMTESKKTSAKISNEVPIGVFETELPDSSSLDLAGKITFKAGNFFKSDPSLEVTATTDAPISLHLRPISTTDFVFPEPEIDRKSVV